MAKTHFFPKVLTTAFESLKISEEPNNWEFRNAVDHYSLSLQWPKESKGRKTRTKRKVTNYSNKANEEMTITDHGQVDQHLRTTTSLSKDSSRTEKGLSGTGEMYSFTDVVDVRKTDFAKVYKGEYKSYSKLDKVPTATTYSSFDNQKEDFERRINLSKTGEQDFEVGSTGKHLSREDRIVGDGFSSQIIDEKCTAEISKSKEKPSSFAAQEYDLKRKPSVDEEESNKENDEDETLNFKMNKFFEENDKADDPEKKKLDVEEKDSVRQELDKTTFPHGYNYITAEPSYESGRKLYGTTSLLITKGDLAESEKSEKMGFSSVTEHRPADVTAASDIQQIPYNHERAVGTQKLEKLKKDYKNVHESHSSVRSFEVGEMSASKKKMAGPAIGKGSDRITIPVSSVRDTQTNLYSEGYKFDSETDKVKVETESDLKNIGYTRRKRVGKESESVTSSSEFSMSLSHIRYRRTLYKKQRSLPRTTTDEERTATTEGNSRASNGTVQADEQHSKVSSLVSTRKRSSYEVRSKRAKCCCGKRFAKKEEAVRHVLSECPINVCFRVYLDIKVNRLIDRWENEANRIMGREWWQMYKTGFFPNVDKRSPVLLEIQNIINEFIQKVSSEKFADKQGGEFVIFEGIESLPSKANEP